MHHFVNGGGGAYLSIGTALDWPERPVFTDYAFYPRTDALRAKLEAETPFWKWPMWWWVRRFGAWPFSVEALSAVFDFNRAPYFQSFMEVRVERSRSRVVLAVIGVDGPLRWRDLQIGGAGRPADQSDDDPAEFVIAMGHRRNRGGKDKGVFFLLFFCKENQLRRRELIVIEVPHRLRRRVAPGPPTLRRGLSAERAAEGIDGANNPPLRDNWRARRAVGHVHS